MFRGRLTQAILHGLDWLVARRGLIDDTPEHLRTGRRGEEDAYFYLRRRGYIMIARNYRSPHYHGELDLIGWDRQVLCFIEVKTRTTHHIKPAEAAVDRHKQKALRLVANDFLSHMPAECERRFDIVSVYYERGASGPTFELFQNAFPVAYNRGFARSY